jgi:hypothetical protein
MSTETKHTPIPWKLNHWCQGGRGITCVKKENGITYFTGDAVGESRFEIISDIKHDQHNIQADFQGAHVGIVYDFSDESKANAELIIRAVNNHAPMVEALEKLLSFAPDVRMMPRETDFDNGLVQAILDCEGVLKSAKQQP